MTPPSPDPLFRVGNGLEAALWIAIGVVFAGYGLMRYRRSEPALRRRCGIAFLVFVAFGLTDVVEMNTGAWWRPWWLFVWKAACVLAMLGLLVDHWRSKRAK